MPHDVTGWAPPNLQLIYTLSVFIRIVLWIVGPRHIQAKRDIVSTG